MVDFGEEKQEWVLSKPQTNTADETKLPPSRQECGNYSKNPEIISDLINTLASQRQKNLETKLHETMLNSFEVIFLGHAGIVVHLPEGNESIHKRRNSAAGSDYLENIRTETRMINWQSIKEIDKKISPPNLINNFNDKYQENIDTVKRRDVFGKLNIAEAIIKFAKDALALRERQA
jgi:hypothetical protein